MLAIYNGGSKMMRAEEGRVKEECAGMSKAGERWNERGWRKIVRKTSSSAADEEGKREKEARKWKRCIKLITRLAYLC